MADDLGGEAYRILRVDSPDQPDDLAPAAGGQL
jgi:hypothetical protein